MDRHNPPPPPSIIRQRTTIQILNQTSSLFYSHLRTFLFLSSLLFTFRSNVHTASHYLSSLIDRDPSLKSLLSRIDFSGVSRLHHHRQRGRAFLRFSRVGTLEDDFFSGDSDFGHSFFYPSSRKPLPNATIVTLSDLNPDYDFSGYVVDNGVTFHGIVKPGDFGFKLEFEKNITPSEEEDTTFVVSNLDDAYAYVVFAYIFTYSWAIGVIFLRVVDHLLGNHRSFFRTVWDGSSIGLKRLSGLILMKWAVRDALAQLMGIYFFGEIEDQYLFLKVFLGMKFMPFANLVPWVTGHEWESAGFIVIWFLSDLIVGLIFAIDSWVAIVDSRIGGREIVKEGCRMLVALFCPAFEIRWLEAIICGSAVRWMLRRIFGEVFTMVFQSLMEVYFMVAWLNFYFAAREKDDNSLGMAFGRRELEGLLDIAR
ncbi:UNVERIFIED_CONTAM: hypothetical protein Scaly_1734000 [Sesamum calycinum]|uniref:Uncharacterized protein n=1 Tax=Sesamum calycinum TaxID=2727403 RepID=A0AAW2NUD3_9LAMI